MSEIDTLPGLLEALAHDCDNTDGWEGAAPDLRQAATALTTLSQHNAKLVEALRPFAKAGELFADDLTYEPAIYCPAAGKDYWLVASDLVRARQALNEGVQP